jgi:hypothetical protein
LIRPTLATAPLLGHRGSRVAASLALLILSRHLPALILVTTAIVLTPLRVCRRCHEDQRRRCRKYLSAFHTPPHPENFYTTQYTRKRPACRVEAGTFPDTTAG